MDYLSVDKQYKAFTIVIYVQYSITLINKFSVTYNQDKIENGAFYFTHKSIFHIVIANNVHIEINARYNFVSLLTS